MKSKKTYLLPVLMMAAVLGFFLLTRNASLTAEERAPAEKTAAESTEVADETTAKSKTGNKPSTDQETADNSEEITQERPFVIQITDDDPAVAYVLVRLQQGMGLLPLPAEGEYTRTIRQVMADGTEAINVLHLTPDGFWMEDANCEGHDCINEGEVTLANREERVLWNMIICLPHQLSAELITREEALSLLNR